MTIAHFYQSISPGFFTFPDFYEWAVGDLVRRYSGQHLHAVEVGVHTGQSAAYLAVEMSNRLVGNGVLDLVDSMLPDDIVTKYLAPVAHMIGAQCRMTSVDAAERYEDGGLDLVFLDADHARVAEDIAAWHPKVRPGGILAGHDFTPDMLPDGPQVIRDVIANFERFEVWRGIKFEDGKFYPTWSVRV